MKFEYIRKEGALMFKPEYAEVAANFCSSCSVCNACSVCHACAVCLIDGPVPDGEVGFVGEVGHVGIVLSVASW